MALKILSRSLLANDRDRSRFLVEPEGFVRLRRIGLVPGAQPALLGARPRFYAIGLEAWSRYADQPVGGPLRVELLEYVE